MAQNDASTGGKKQENPYRKPRPIFDVQPHFVDEYNNPWAERVERPDMRDMVAVSTVWDREYNMPVVEGCLFWGTVGQFWSLYYAVNRFAADEERRESPGDKDTDRDPE